MGSPFIRSFFYREKRTKKATSFCQKEARLKPAFSETTSFRIRNSLIKIFLQHLESPSLRGFEKSEVIHNVYSFFKNCIATPHAVCLTATARNDNFNYIHAFSYKLKNNFAILNLVKSFLTSITFDSLSRKIKNPCLVINKNSFLRIVS